jgi:hypothetical protein
MADYAFGSIRPTRLTGSKGQNRIDVRAFEIRIFLEDRFGRLPRGHQAKNVRDRYTQTANTWTAMHLVEIGRYSFEEVCHWLHPWLR